MQKRFEELFRASRHAERCVLPNPSLYRCLCNVERFRTPGATLRFNIIQGTVHASADCFPVDPHVFGNDAAGQVYGKPAYGKIEVFCKATAGISPRNVCNKNAMLRAFNTMGVVHNFNKCCSPVQCSPGTKLLVFSVIAFTSLMTDGTVILMPYIGSSMDTDMVYTIVICEEA